MANQNLAIVVLVTYLVSLMCGGVQCSTQDCVRNVAEATLLAHDAIVLSIEETKVLKRFVNRVVRLKSLQQLSENASGLGYCSNAVAHHLGKLTGTLYRLKHLKKAATLMATSPPLKGHIDGAMVSVEACRVAIGDVDTAFAEVLTRKLNDLSFMLEDVEFRVSQLTAAQDNNEAFTNP
nr:putative pectinesterase inhibitor domain-containing protein [Ipomoea batatas]GMD51775.1 putative pectinesterase inhibitor domain-containing protein [Ipomoea batatas]GME21728.1 putative pectinesterase inhibitor domain-containing protein [Ipomoea batatas]